MRRTLLLGCLIISSTAAAFAAPGSAAPPASVESPSFHSFMSPEPDSHSILYTVKSGDNLTTIAKKHGVAVGLIRRVNQLKDDRIRAGQSLKIPTAKLSLLIDKSDNQLQLKADEDILKTYVVSTGKDNSTPVGSFQITNKLENPTWYKSGAVIPPGSQDNQLGTRWMGFNLKGYGIHGTIAPETLGQQVTAGCVRMKNEDVEELYGLISPGTSVTIVD